jgi:HAD superfamily phosphatase (TIGR01668 family)
VILLAITDKFRPTWKADGVALIDFDALWEQGLSKLLLDVDGTITKVCSMIVPEEIVQNLRIAKESDWEICLTSNAHLWFMANRIERLAEILQCQYIAHYWPHPTKPNSVALEKAMSRMDNAIKGNTLMVGDQFGTDILGANQLGIRSIWVPPIEPIPLWKRITLEVINQRRLRALGEIPKAPTRVY